MIEKVGERYGTDYSRCPRREEKQRHMKPQVRGKGDDTAKNRQEGGEV